MKRYSMIDVVQRIVKTIKFYKRHHASERAWRELESRARPWVARRVRCDEHGILEALRGGQSYRQVAREHGVSLAKVQRVRAEASAAG